MPGEIGSPLSPSVHAAKGGPDVTEEPRTVVKLSARRLGFAGPRQGGEAMGG
jgi:hypothetical protein